ncbi:unnamed protein product [Peniophora sp. CBMAI 1063]|nr:unnamed protein product [Peniophora sp. CBMAI 1063]
MVARVNSNLTRTLPRPAISRRWAHIPARPLHPSTPPPPHLLSVFSPPLHRLPRSSLAPGPELSIPGYKCSTHVFPAAWPRSTPLVPFPDDLRDDIPRALESKEERRARLARGVDAMLTLKRSQEREAGRTLDPDQRMLWVTATRWVRTGPSLGNGNKTVLCTHGNGMHAGTFAPTLRRLLSRRSDIAEAWALDAVHHGDAGLLNAGNLGALFDWRDTARDVLCLLQHFLPPTPTLGPLPTVLTRTYGKPRRVFGLGHSFGGGVLALAATRHPELFSALMLADPVIAPSELDRTIQREPGWVAPDGTRTISGYPSLHGYTLGALGRRSVWPSQAAALEALAAHPVFSTWHRDAREVYVKHAMVEGQDGQVRLKCEGKQEAAVYVESRAANEAWSALPFLDERVPLLWVNPPAGESIAQTREIAAVRVRLRPANSAHVIVPNGLHLIVQTNPRQVADAVNVFMDAVKTNTVGYARAFRLPETESTVLPQINHQRTPLPRWDMPPPRRVGQLLAQV